MYIIRWGGIGSDQAMPPFRVLAVCCGCPFLMMQIKKQDTRSLSCPAKSSYLCNTYNLFCSRFTKVFGFIRVSQKSTITISSWRT